MRSDWQVYHGADISMHVEKNGSDEISCGNQIGSDTFQNGLDIIRYPTVILSPAYQYRLEKFMKLASSQTF